MQPIQENGYWEEGYQASCQAEGEVKPFSLLLGGVYIRLLDHYLPDTMTDIRADIAERDGAIR